MPAQHQSLQALAIARPVYQPNIQQPTSTHLLRPTASFTRHDHKLSSIDPYLTAHHLQEKASETNAEPEVQLSNSLLAQSSGPALACGICSLAVFDIGRKFGILCAPHHFVNC